MTADSKDPIAFYFDLFSPFGYLASTQIEKIAARHGRSVDWRPVLVGITVLKIMDMRPLPTYPLKGPYLDNEMERFAKLYNVPFKRHGLQNHNSLNAMRAFVWLKEIEPRLATDFAKAIYARLWIEGNDITSMQACADEAEKLGVDRDDLLEALASSRMKHALRRDVQSAIDNGVFGVPFFIADGEKFFGNDHIWMMEHWLENGSWSSE